MTGKERYAHNILRSVMAYENNGVGKNAKRYAWSALPEWYDKMQEMLDRITYKPNFFFSLASCPYTHRPIIVVSAETEDTHRPGVYINVALTHLMHPDELNSSADFCEAVYRSSRALEWHECMEWFRVNDKLWHDPHDLDTNGKDEYYKSRGIRPAPRAEGVER